MLSHVREFKEVGTRTPSPCPRTRPCFACHHPLPRGLIRVVFMSHESRRSAAAAAGCVAGRLHAPVRLACVVPSPSRQRLGWWAGALQSCQCGARRTPVGIRLCVWDGTGCVPRVVAVCAARGWPLRSQAVRPLVRPDGALLMFAYAPHHILCKSVRSWIPSMLSHVREIKEVGTGFS